MQRFTAGEKGAYYIEKDALRPCDRGYEGAGAQRLAQYETMCKDLLDRHEKATRELELLRAEGKERTARFRELLGNRMIDASVINMYKFYGIL